MIAVLLQRFTYKHPHHLRSVVPSFFHVYSPDSHRRQTILPRQIHALRSTGSAFRSTLHSPAADNSSSACVQALHSIGGSRCPHPLQWVRRPDCEDSVQAGSLPSAGPNRSIRQPQPQHSRGFALKRKAGVVFGLPHNTVWGKPPSKFACPTGRFRALPSTGCGHQSTQRRLPYPPAVPAQRRNLAFAFGSYPSL